MYGASIVERDQHCWFGTEKFPTCRAVSAHTRRVNDIDRSFPILLAADGRLMDGGHRIANAWLLGYTAIAAVRFVPTPESDYVVPAPDES